MSASEATRHRVYEALKESHSEEMAADVLALLPPAGVPDLATKDDVRLLRAELVSEIGSVRGDIETMEARLRLEIAERFNRSVHLNLGAIAVATTLLGLLITLG